MPTPRQRLIVCLDGTWNNRNDRTNVSHHYDLVTEGLVPPPPGGTEPIYQRKYYDAGVGTGLLDRITGGGFGIGLEENVCEAYDWLAEHYREGAKGEGDEIFVFGFSRGAYTARSLVGFIGRCGLLRRGSPLSINQLWAAYCIIGRQHEQRATLAERLFGGEQSPMREINQLVSDPWEGAVPRATDLNGTERLLLRWSRRVKITYLGVYDTVGAMGIDALAIPTLKSRLALHHNMRPTTLIQHCRHALALDEHRSSFNHTPFLSYSGHGPARADQKGADQTPAELERYWEQVKANWEKRIEQRWFVGAHANIGGGYPNNVLAEIPLRWLLDGASAAGLACEPLPAPETLAPLPAPRDSHAEFARPLWSLLLRVKRHYRQLAPPDEARASVREHFINHDRPPGFSLCSINEQFDDHVWSYYRAAPPPHLVEYIQRTRPACAAGIDVAACVHPWMGAGAGAYALTAMLAAFTAVGMIAAGQLFAPGSSFGTSPLWLAASALLFLAADWGESWMNFQLALQAGPPARRAFRDGIYWTRSICVLLGFVGAVSLAVSGWHEGWSAAGRAAMRNSAIEHLLFAWPAAAAGAMGVVLLLLGGGSDGRRGRDLAGALGGGLVVLLVSPLFISAGFFTSRLLTVGPVEPTLAGATGNPTHVAFAGMLLLLQLAFIYFVRALAWCAEPMERANLGQMLRLQFSFTPKHFKTVFARWRKLLGCPWRPDAARQMPTVVGEALARDTIGFVPVYVLVFLFGLYFAETRLSWTWLSFPIAGLPLWIVLPFGAAAFDYAEDALHWVMIRLDAEHFENPASPGLDRSWAWLLAVPAGLCSMLKFAGAIPAALLTVAAISAGTIAIIIDRMETGWRGVPVLLISTGAAVFLVATILGILWFRWRPMLFKV